MVGVARQPDPIDVEAVEGDLLYRAGGHGHHVFATGGPIVNGDRDHVLVGTSIPPMASRAHLAAALGAQGARCKARVVQPFLWPSSAAADAAQGSAFDGQPWWLVFFFLHR